MSAARFQPQETNSRDVCKVTLVSTKHDSLSTIVNVPRSRRDTPKPSMRLYGDHSKIRPYLGSYDFLLHLRMKYVDLEFLLSVGGALFAKLRENIMRVFEGA